MPTKQVSLGSQILHGDDRAGQWIVEKLTRWYDLPATKGEAGERPLADGDYEAERFYGPRMITVDGILFHTGRGALVSAMEQLNISASTKATNLVVTDAGLSRRAVVKTLGVDWTHTTTRASRFQIRLKASDPFKYGESYAQTGSSATPASLFHRGNAPAWPVVTINNASTATGYTLSLNGKTVVVTKSLYSASTHTIDFKTGILRENGNVVRGGLSTANFSPINPGLPQNMSTTAGNITVRYADTFI